MEYNMSMKESCGNCKFFNEWDTTSPQSYSPGVCRRFPPRETSFMVDTYIFPKTDSENWCGEWKTKNNVMTG